MKSLLHRATASLALLLAWTGPAHAEAAPQEAGFGSFVPLILIMVIFYFLLIRPQQKKLKEHADTIKTLKKGDKVITGGGIYGTVTDVQEKEIAVKIAEGVVIKVKNDTIAGLVNNKNDKDS